MRNLKRAIEAARELADGQDAVAVIVESPEDLQAGLERGLRAVEQLEGVLGPVEELTVVVAELVDDEEPEPNQARVTDRYCPLCGGASTLLGGGHYRCRHCGTNFRS
jgi:hypothetical protein